MFWPAVFLAGLGTQYADILQYAHYDEEAPAAHWCILAMFINLNELLSVLMWAVRQQQGMGRGRVRQLSVWDEWQADHRSDSMDSSSGPCWGDGPNKWMQE